MKKMKVNKYGSVVYEGAKKNETVTMNGLAFSCGGKAMQEANDTRDEMVKRWNMHDELVKMLEIVADSKLADCAPNLIDEIIELLERHK